MGICRADVTAVRRALFSGGSSFGWTKRRCPSISAVIAASAAAAAAAAARPIVLQGGGGGPERYRRSATRRIRKTIRTDTIARILLAAAAVAVVAAATSATGTAAFALGGHRPPGCGTSSLPTFNPALKTIYHSAHRLRPILIAEDRHFMSPLDPKNEGSRAPTRLANGLQPFETDAIAVTDDDEDIAMGGTASVPNLVTSLIKSIIGSGVLALPAGMAAMGDVPAQVLPASYVLIVVTATLNAGFFAAIGKVCGATSSKTFQQCWDRSVGPESSAVVATVITLKTFLSCLAFSIILADSLSSLLDLPRTIVLWSITVTAILPLTLLKDIKSLAPFSALGLAGMGVTSAAMLARWLDGTYGTHPDGQFVQALADNVRPEFGAAAGGTNYLHGVVLACSLATAFMAHYNAPRFHAELSNNTAPRFQTVTFVSYAVSAVLFGLVATAGYLTFGGHSQGFILNNYAAADPLILVSRFALSLSILLTYPLPFVGLRDGCLDLLRTIGLPPAEAHQPQAVPTEDSDLDEEVVAIPATPSDKGSLMSLDTTVTLGLLFLVTVAATFCRDLGLVVSVGGGTFSTAVASVFPTLMLTSLHRKQGGGGAHDVGSTEVAVAWIGMAISVAIGMAGVGLALSNAFG